MGDVARKQWPFAVAAAVVAVLAVSGYGVLFWRAQALPDGPVDIVWDQQACAYCHMHVGDPKFAAQVQLKDGAVLVFDDPGCMLSWLAGPHAPLRATYLRDAKDDRWLTKADVAFAEVGATPMGFGLGAVQRGTPNALTWEEAEARVASQRAKRGME